MTEHNYIFLSKTNTIFLSLFFLLAIFTIIVLFKINTTYYNELETLKKDCVIQNNTEQYRV